MQIPKIKTTKNTFPCIKFKLSDKTVKSIEKSTGLSCKEMTNLTLDESKKLMIKRSVLKEPSKLKQWFINKYKQIGEKLGLLEKKYNIYTDID